MDIQLSPEVIALVIRAYDEAYESSRADLKPAEGDDGHVFGVMIWRRAVARLAYYAERYGVRYAKKNNHIELRLPGGSLRPYPGGRNPLDDTAKLPFRTDSAAKTELVNENTEQLTLFADLPHVRLVLLHIGDVAIGLRELWVGAPYLDENEDVVGWDSIQRIYSAEEFPQEHLGDQPLRPFTPFAERDLPDVDMGPRRDVGDNKGRHKESE